MADKIVCDVCKKEFSGEIPAQQHFESKAHQKAMRNKEMIDRYDLRFTPAQFKCDICNVNMNSDEVKQRHMCSPKHLEMERRAKTIASRDSSIVNGISPEQGHVSSHGGKGYDFNGVRGYCYICKIELTSKAVADQHINGEKHLKKKTSQQRTILQQPPVSRCAVISTCNACGEGFSNQHDVEVHFSSQKHKEKLASLDTVSLNTERHPTLSTVSETSYYPTENLAHIASGSSSGAVVRRVGYGSTSSTAVNGVYEFNGSSGHCHICNVALTSEENAKAHLLGTRHRKALVKSGGETRKDPQAANSSEYYFNGDRGKCLVCDIDLTSERHAQDHLSGAKHTKAVQRQAEAKTKDHHASDAEEYEMNGNRGFCHVCQLELTSVEHATQHIDGRPHAKAKLVWEKRRLTGNRAQGILSPSSVAGERSLDMEPTSPGLGVVGHWPSQGQRSDLSGSSDSSTFLSNEDVTKRIPSGNINQNQTNQVPKSPGSNQNTSDGFRGNKPISEDGTQEYWFTGLTGYCNLCSIELTSQAHAMQHINGKNHAKARQRSQTKPIGSSNVNLYCKICNVPFSGQESAQQHYRSDKHRKREQMKMCPSGEPPAPDQKVLDNTNWYPCIVCGCYLNSKEQLESHEQSVSHKVATEGLNSLGFQETLVMATGGSSVERIVRVNKGGFDSGDQQTVDSSKSSSRQEFNPESGTPSKDSVKFEPISLDQHGSLDPASLRQSYATSGGTGPEETLLKSVYHFQHSDEFNTLPSNLNANNYNSGSLKEKEVNKQSFLSQISMSGNSSSAGSFRSSRSRSPDSHSRSPSVGIESHAGFDKNSSLKSHGKLSSNHSGHSSNQSSLESGPQSSGSENRMPSLEPIDMNDDIPDLVSICTSMSELKIKKDRNNAEKKEVKVKDFTRKKERKERQTVEVTTLDHIPVPCNVVDVSEIGALGSGESTPGHRTRRGEGTDTARALRNRTSRRKTSEELDRSVSQESESNDDPDKDTDSSMARQSVGHERSHTQLMSLISQKLKDIPQKPAIGTLAETENSVRKNYKHYCPTCKVPMDTEKALQDHLKGKLHRMKSAKEPACSRQLPPLTKTIS
ncbi:uncharacterized protein LOC110444541, partial [Mizuhopecten yessoensis]|uniref:uncharacterized protein LOC110444541 n=1 Tax=Mizuhopecten yessoensis TaxID=6573 RepID=UPI000B45B8F1